MITNGTASDSPVTAQSGHSGRLAWNVTIDWNEPRARAAIAVTAIDRNCATRTAASAGTIARAYVDGFSTVVGATSMPIAPTTTPDNTHVAAARRCGE